MNHLAAAAMFIAGLAATTVLVIQGHPVFGSVVLVVTVIVAGVVGVEDTESQVKAELAEGQQPASE